MNYEMQPYLSRRWDDELYHFGIKGQKYGVRRFQNLDRTWTEAGKIRYGRKGSKRRDNHQNINLEEEYVNKLDKYDDAYSQYEDEFYDDKKRYEEWLNKQVDAHMKEYGNEYPELTREWVYNQYKYGDFDQGGNSIFDKYIRESNDKEAVTLREMKKDVRKAYDKAHLEKYKYDYDEVKNKDNFPKKNTEENNKGTSSSERLAKAISDYAKANGVSEKDIIDDLSGRISIQDTSKLKNVSNTNSLKTRWKINQQQAKQNRDFMFNRKNDLTDIQKEYYKELRKQKKDQHRSYDSRADFYYYNKDIINKFVDKYSKQLLKNMGYRDDDDSVKWLVSQKWYKIPSEFFRGGLDVIM